MAGLLAEEGDRDVGPERGPSTLPLSPETPDGRSTATTGTPAAAHRSIAARASPLERLRQAGAEQRVDDQRTRLGTELG